MEGLNSILMVLLSFRLSICNVVLEETTETKRKNFNDTLNFVLDVKSKSENKREFITKMQAVFCPNQPLCDDENILTGERSDVINELGTELTIGNEMVKLDDLAARLGLCCMPCDCSDSCDIKGNCCPSKNFVNRSRAVTELRFDCVQASSLAYISRADNKVPYFFMVTHCFGDKTNETILGNCENPSLYTTGDLNPVTSLRTGQTYWNEPCSSCNADSGKLLRWKSYAGFTRPIMYFSDFFCYPDSVEKLKRILANDLNFSPPYTMDDERCFPEEHARLCDTPAGMFNNASSFLLEMCNDHYNPVTTFFTGLQTGYRNIFCFFCSQFQHSLLRKTMKTICIKDETKFAIEGITALLDYKSPESKVIQQTLKDQGYTAGKCGCHEIYDNVKDMCRPLLCPLGEFLKGCQCQQPMKILSGMPVQLAVKISSGDQELNDITQNQMLSLHAAIEGGLRKIVDHASVEVFATFKQETDSKTYLISAVRVISDAGYDTKSTIKPFLKYQHSNEKAFVVQIKKHYYSIALTDRIKFWVATTYMCKDHDAPDGVPTLLYLDEALRQATKHKYYQALSSLLYCLQVRLEWDEFQENDGVVTINRTDPPYLIYDFYKAESGRVQVCVDDYFPKSNEAVDCPRKYIDSMVLLFVLFWIIKICL